MGVVRKQAGAQSVSFFVTGDYNSETELWTTEFQIKAPTWAALPAGKLRDLLTATYLKPVTPATVPPTYTIDPAAFLEAMAANGAFQVTSAYNDENLEDSEWSLVEADPVLPTDPPKGSPVLTVFADSYTVGEETNYATVVRVSCSYSASE